MKRILHIAFESSYGGVVSVFRGISRNLPEYNHTLLAVVRGSAHDELHSLGINAAFLFGKRSFLKLNRSLKLLAFGFYLLRNRYGIIHYHTGGISILLLAYLFRKKARIVHHVHSGNITGSTKAGSVAYWQLKILQYLSTRTIQIAVSDTAAAKYREIIANSAELRVIRNYPGINFQHRNGLTYNIGYIGRSAQGKGLDSVFCIAGEILERKLPYRIKVKSDLRKANGNYGEKFLRLIESEKPSFDTAEFYGSIDLLLFPSVLSEGCPLVILEAVSAGTGIIALRTEAVKEILGDYPLLVDTFRAEEVIVKILNFYNNCLLRESLNELHREILTRYGEAESTAVLKSLYGL